MIFYEILWHDGKQQIGKSNANVRQFRKKFSFCANEQFRVFETALRGRGISPVARIRNFAGGCFIDIVVKGGGGVRFSHPLFSINASFFKSPHFLEIQDFPTFYRPIRKIKVLNESPNRFVYNFFP